MPNRRSPYDARPGDDDRQGRRAQSNVDRDRGAWRPGDDRSGYRDDERDASIAAPDFSPSMRGEDRFGQRNEGGYRGSGGEREPVSFRGCGPKGYTRSDQRIHEDVCDRLTEDHDVDARDIEVKVANGEVTMTGKVADRAMKYRAEEIADRVTGVKDIDNQLRIARTRKSLPPGEQPAELEPGDGKRKGGASA